MHEAGRRIDVAGGADGDEEIGLAQRLVNVVHTQRHLAEPHHVWPQRRRELAAVATVVNAEIAGPFEHLARLGAAHLQQFAVHVQHPLAAGALMQVIDVLRDQQEVVPQPLFQSASARCAAFGAISSVCSWRRRSL